MLLGSQLTVGQPAARRCEVCHLGCFGQTGARAFERDVGYLDQDGTHGGAVGPGAVGHAGWPFDGLPVIDGAALITHLHPATTGDDDEETQVGAGLRRDQRTAREGQLGDAGTGVGPDGLVAHTLCALTGPGASEAGAEAQDLHVGPSGGQRRFFFLDFDLALERPFDLARMVASAEAYFFWARYCSRRRMAL